MHLPVIFHILIRYRENCIPWHELVVVAQQIVGCLAMHSLFVVLILLVLHPEKYFIINLNFKTSIYIQQRKITLKFTSDSNNKVSTKNNNSSYIHVLMNFYDNIVTVVFFEECKLFILLLLLIS